jgi:hypothetical protein
MTVLATMLATSGRGIGGLDCESVRFLADRRPNERGLPRFRMFTPTLQILQGPLDCERIVEVEETHIEQYINQ